MLLMVTDLQSLSPAYVTGLTAPSLFIALLKLVGHRDELVGPVPYLALPWLRHCTAHALLPVLGMHGPITRVS